MAGLSRMMMARIIKMVRIQGCRRGRARCHLCNSGLVAARAADLFALLARVGNDNAQGEYYLPDIVKHRDCRRVAPAQ